MAGWQPPRPPIRTHLRGKNAEVWENAERVGLLFHWDLAMHDGEWIATARRYRLAATSGERLSLRFFKELEEEQVELTGENATIFSPFEADERAHKGPITIKGLRLVVIQ